MSASSEPTEPAGGREPGGIPGDRREPTRITQERGGPTLVEGPVEIVDEDGTTTRSDRPVVALCTCRRSRHYPFCDTSHRPKQRD